MNNSDGFTYMVHISKALKEEDEKEDEKAFEEDEKEDETLQLSQTWPNLQSGTPYFICVKTIGPLHLNSNSSCIIVTTSKWIYRTLVIVFMSYIASHKSW